MFSNRFLAFRLLLLLLANATPCRAKSTPGMAWIPAGEFSMGCEDCGMPEAKPVHQVRLDGFWLDRTPVTNAEFAVFGGSVNVGFRCAR